MTILLVRTLCGLLGAYMIAAAVFQWPHAGPLIDYALAIAAALASAGLTWFFRHSITRAFRRLSEFLISVPKAHWVVGCLAIGLALRILSAAVFPADYVTDHLHYWETAQKLAAGEPYEWESRRSFWPPGLPFVLTPFLFLFGPERWIPLLINLLLFAGTMLCAVHLAERAAGPRAARLAGLLVALWPNLILLVGLPSKELLSAFLLSLAVVFYLRTLEDDGRWPGSRWGAFLGSGFCLGFAALTQPASVLFGIVFLGLEASLRAPLYRKALRLALVGSLAVLTVIPWTIRNYAVHGAFVPINTAGGEVLYSANNPNATGGWINPELYFDDEMIEADEITRNRLGYQKAVAWISQNKAQFVKLMVIKQTRFLCCDDYGVFMLFDHPDLTQRADPALRPLVGTASNAFWILLALLILCAAIVPGGFVGRRPPFVLLMLLGIWFFLAVFSVFQSERKHHINVAVFMAVLASCALPGREASRGQDGESRRISGGSGREEARAG